MYAYSNTQASVIDMFMDRTAGESSRENRLMTEETDAGNVALVAYGWIKVAEYDEERNVVTVFGGHTKMNSSTVSGYINRVANRAESRGRDVVLSGDSPYVGTPNAGIKYINNYVRFAARRSGVERDAVSEVLDQLRKLDPR